MQTSYVPTHYYHEGRSTKIHFMIYNLRFKIINANATKVNVVYNVIFIRWAIIDIWIYAYYERSHDESCLILRYEDKTDVSLTYRRLLFI